MRDLIRDRRQWAALLLGLALCMKMLVPSGFMLSGRTVPTIVICTGQGNAPMLHMAVPRGDHAHDLPGQSGKTADVCPYAALALAGLAGAPAALLLVALGFILLLGMQVVVQPPRRSPAFLRPHLRAPPRG